MDNYSGTLYSFLLLVTNIVIVYLIVRLLGEERFKFHALNVAVYVNKSDTEHDRNLSPFLAFLGVY